DNGKYFICYDVLENILYETVYNFNEDEIKNIVKELFLGIAILHKRKIMHCDIKPENIGFDRNGYLKLFDFGISNKLDSGYRMNISSGTPNYMPPEFCISYYLEPHADWWAFGITIYKIIENQYPFSGKKRISRIPVALKNENFRGFTRDIDNNLKDLIEKLLEVDSDKRLGVGNNGTEDILKHPFFENTNIEKLYRKEK
ncbi:Protein kinase, partial [Spraguea lophii 42_110]